MGKLVNAVKKGLSFFTVGSDHENQNKKPSKVTNKILYGELVQHFNEQIDELSVGKRVLYPMSFNILMHPDDYYHTRESLPFVLPEVVSEFYTSIKEKAKFFGEGVNFAPPATYWFFQFSACQYADKEGEEGFIKRGEIVTTGSLTTFDILKAQQGNVRQEANVHLSVKCQNSNTNKNNINLDALLGMDILSEGTYTFDFDKNLVSDTSRISAVSNLQRKKLAELRWVSENGNYKVYDMIDNYIDISGSAETRTTSNILRVESNAVIVSHVQIKYDVQAKTFALAAYEKTRLNSREVPLSVTGGIPQWVPLPKFNSRIFINDTISIEFNANSDKA